MALIIRIRDWPSAKAAREVVLLHCARHGMDAQQARRHLSAATRELMRGGSSGMAIVLGKQGTLARGAIGGAA